MQHSVAILEQCCHYSKQCSNNVAALCCAKNRRFESSPVISPLQSCHFGKIKGVVTRDDSQRRFLAQHSAAMLEQCCNHSKQCSNAVFHAVLRKKSSLRIVSCNITLSCLLRCNPQKQTNERKKRSATCKHSRGSL